MISSHHSFSTRIFLDEPPAAHASANAADANKSENLREFWWFLRSGRGQVQGLASTQPAATPLLPNGKKHA